MANAYLAKQKALQNELFKQGFDHGLQWGFDMAIIALNRAFGFGNQRAIRLAEAMLAAQDEFGDAISANDESDVQRVRLDRELEAIYGELKFSFMQRYPAAKDFHYNKRVGDK